MMNAWKFSSNCVNLLFAFLRILAALVLAAFVSPLIATAVLVDLPECGAVRQLQRGAARAIAAVAAVAGVVAQVGAKCDVRPDPNGTYRWLSAPVVRLWSAPLPHGRTVKTFDQPGRWMTDQDLAELHEMLFDVARGSMGTVPVHRLFDKSKMRQVFSNRIVSLALDDKAQPIAFAAMVYLPYAGDVVLHLGLTMIKVSARRTRLQSPLFIKCLSMIALNLFRHSYLVTSIAASPAGIGSVSDYFWEAFPHYLGSTRCTSRHMSVAKHVLKHFRHEFGCSERAVFDERTFVVRGSNEPKGGGAAAFIKEDGKPVSQHKSFKCNEFVCESLDLSAGDEIFQVATMDFFHTLSSYIYGLRGGTR